MSAKTQITADFATPNDVASRLRVSAARAAELRRQMFNLQPTGDALVLAAVKTPASRRKNAATTSNVRASRSKKK